MSLDAMHYAKDITVVTSAEKLVLLLLADFHHPSKNIAWPSMQTLARLAIMSDRNVRRVLTALEAKGILKREYPADRRDTIFYSFPALSKADNMSAHRPDNMSAHDRTNETSKADTKADKSSIAIRKNGLTVLNGKPSEAVASAAPADPLWQFVIDTFNDAFKEVNGTSLEWDPRDFAALKRLRLHRTKSWTKIDFEKAIAHWFLSDDVNPAALPCYVFAKLPEYRVGPLTTRHIPKNGTKPHDPQIATRSQQIANDNKDITRRAAEKVFGGGPRA